MRSSVRGGLVARICREDSRDEGLRTREKGLRGFGAEGPLGLRDCGTEGLRDSPVRAWTAARQPVWRPALLAVGDWLSAGGLYPVEEVAAAGVVEVVGGVVGHAQFLHDVEGAEIGGDREGDDFLEVESGEGVVEDGAGAFRGQPLAPVFVGESPADFDCGLGAKRDGQLEGGNVEAYVADEVAGMAKFSCPEAEVMKGKVSFDATDHEAGFYLGEGGGIVLHDAGVGV
jgi:hypothetical protein